MNKEQNEKKPANLMRNPATASDMALSFSSTHLSQYINVLLTFCCLSVCYWWWTTCHSEPQRPAMQ